MSKFLALTKLLFVQQYRIKPSVTAKNPKRQRAGRLALPVVLALCFAPMLVSVAFVSYNLGALGGADSGIVALLLLICQGLVLIFGVQSIITNVFSAKDADKLLFLPLKPITVFLAKLTVVYVNEVLTSAVTLLALLLPYGIGASVGAGYYVMLVFALLLLPMLPMFIGCIVALPMSLISNKMGNNSIAKTVVRIVFFVAVMALYMGVMYSMGFMSGSTAEEPSLSQVAQMLLDKISVAADKMVYVHTNYVLASCMVQSNVGMFFAYFAAAIGENALLLGLVVAITLPFYRKLLQGAIVGGGKAKVRSASTAEQAKSRGVVGQLMISDFRRVARDSQLGFQSFASLVVMPLIIVMMAISFMQPAEDGQSTIQVLQSFDEYQLIAPLAILVYLCLFGVSTNILGLYPISRENKSLYMLKLIPVPFSKILFSKVLLSTVVMLVCDFVTCVLVVALFGIEWYFGIALLAVMALLGFGSMCITTLFDLKRPKLGWTNFNQSLKNAANSWIAMLVGLLCAVGVAVVAGGFVVWQVLAPGWYVMLLMWLSLAGVSVGFAVVSYKIMAKKAQYYFERIDA